MPWNDDVITGSNSVSANKTPLNQNSQYVKSNVGKNHYWNGKFIDNGSTITRAGLDGFHSHIELPAFENPVGTAADPTLSSGIDGAFYVKEVTKEDTNIEDIPLYKSDNSTPQILGHRAAVNFEGTTIKWQFNVATVTSPSEGVYLITFSNALPSNNYIVSGTAYRNGTPLVISIDANGSTYGTNVTTTTLRVRFTDSSGNAKNITQASLLVMGG
jgi:hypothetical protein